MANITAQAKWPGSIWIWNYKDQDWPVMLCDDSIPTPEFIATLRKGESAAIVLGRRKYTQVREDGLKAFDPHMDYLADRPPFDDTTIRAGDNEAIILQKQRQIAFKQDARDLDLTPSHLKNFIENRKEIREMERDLAAKHKREKRKRKRTPTVDSNDEDDVQIVGVTSAFIKQGFRKPSLAHGAHGLESGQPATPAATPRKKRSRPSKGSAHLDDDDDLQILNLAGSSTKPQRTRCSDKSGIRGSNSGQLPTPGITPMKKRFYLPPALTHHQSGELDSDEEELFVRQDKRRTVSDESGNTEHGQQNLREHYGRKDLPKGEDECTIFVSSAEGETGFIVSRKRVSESQSLENLVQFGEEEHECIYLPDELDIPPIRLAPVAEYLRTGEFTPRIAQSASGLPELLSLTTPKMRDKAAESIAWVHSIAGKLQLGKLQKLATDKLRALYPLSPLQLLIVAKILETSSSVEQGSDDPIMPWVTDHIAEYYFHLMEDYGSQLSRLMRNNEVLRTAVLEKLANDNNAGMRGFDG